MFGAETGIAGGFALLVLLLVGLVFILYLVPLPLWIAAWASGAYVGLFTLIGMRLRQCRQPSSRRGSSAVKAGLDIPLNDLEAHYLAGGNVVGVVQRHDRGGQGQHRFAFKQADGHRPGRARRSRSGEDVGNPKVIETAESRAPVAKDGIQLKAMARVTVRTNIDRLVGGAGEETIIARVGEGIVTTIGSADSTRMCWKTPTHLQDGPGQGPRRGHGLRDPLHRHRRRGRGREHRRQAADRPGRGRQADRPGQGRRTPRHGRRAGDGQEMRAKVVEAEAEVPRAIAEAFRQGNLGMMDYYRMKTSGGHGHARRDCRDGRRATPSQRR